jgi:hypothetical protein
MAKAMMMAMILNMGFSFLQRSCNHMLFAGHFQAIASVFTA